MTADLRVVAEGAALSVRDPLLAAFRSTMAMQSGLAIGVNWDSNRR